MPAWPLVMGAPNDVESADYPKTRLDFIDEAAVFRAGAFLAASNMTVSTTPERENVG